MRDVFLKLEVKNEFYVSVAEVDGRVNSVYGGNRAQQAERQHLPQTIASQNARSAHDLSHMMTDFIGSYFCNLICWY